LVNAKLTDAESKTWEEMCSVANGGMRPSDFTRTLDALYASTRDEKLDNISCNIYEPFAQVRGANRPSGIVDFWAFIVDSDIYGTFIRAYNDGNTTLPVYLGENGLITRQPYGEDATPRPDGQTRESYFKAYFMEMIRCMKDGVPIRGYLFWSLLDDFEWEHGYTPRCGLHGYDYVRHEILPLDAMGQPAAEVYADLIAALRSGDKTQIATTFIQSHAYRKSQAG
jgi:beta-glucosidase/6-phospho-beta-glucosidase/beta-galactosidase